MYSKCPKCNYRYSWFEKWKLSSKKQTPCPGCGVGLMKNTKSERYSLRAIFIIFYAMLLLKGFGYLKQKYPFLGEDSIELSICMIIALPAFFVSIYFAIKAFFYMKFKVCEADNQEKL